MKKHMILFLFGKDRPGIVDQVSSLLFDKGANIEESRMSALGGYFSIMALFSCEAAQLPAIAAGLADLKKKGFETTLQEARDPSSEPRPEAGLPLKMEVKGLDHPGIVQHLVSRLHQRNTNIHSLDTHITNAPLSGAPLFNLLLEVVVPADMPIADLKQEMTEIAREMNLDLIFTK